MINHLFIADVLHHVPVMVKNILKYAELTNEEGRKEHFFLLRTNKKRKKDTVIRYKSLFNEELNHSGYCFILSNLQLMFYIFKHSFNNKMVIHSIQSLYQRPLLFWVFIYFFLGKTQKRNIVQVIWGLPMNVDDKKHDIFRRFLFSIQCKAMKSLGYVVVLTEDDFQKTKQFYGISDNLIQASYINDDYCLYNGILKRKELSLNTKIMVAHSAFEQNKHFNTFKSLKRFSDRDIEIICPLSYGNETYRQGVLQEGVKLFGSKFKSFLELLPKDEYNKLLASIDIYISHAEMQTSLYVIYFCVSTGKKIFLSQNNYNWMICQGFKISHVNELKDITFEELVKPLPPEWVEHNISLAKKILSVEEGAKKWKLIYMYTND